MTTGHGERQAHRRCDGRGQRIVVVVIVIDYHGLRGASAVDTSGGHAARCKHAEAVAMDEGK